jgi:hypothetical protein
MLRKALSSRVNIALLCAGIVLSLLSDVGRADDVPGVVFTIDAAKDARPISPLIYGINNERLTGPYANLTLRRIGGNRWTAYNWTNNASNAGADWQYENDGMLARSDAPGAAVAEALAEMLDHHSTLILTVPINGYVSADKKGDGDVRNSGPDYLQTRFRPELPAKGKPFTLDPAPDSPVVYQDEFVNWVKSKYPTGSAGNANRVFFSLDNEPDLWHASHLEVHPQPVTYAELVQKSIDYARAIKAVEPAAKILGPVNYGWLGFVSLQNAPDANHRDFQEFYLRQMAEAEKMSGQRLIDLFDVHWYPEATGSGGGERISSDSITPETVAARLQAPRSLWDPTYTETSWIAKWQTRGPLTLIPRLLGKIARNYPGTKLTMTEYNFGGGSHISGAIAEADVLGILGRSGVYAACEWPLGRRERFIAGGFQMYRDFDAANGTFGDISISAQSDNVTDTSVYASLHTGQRDWMTVVAINKTDHDLPASFRIANTSRFDHAAIYQLTAKSPEPQRGDVMHIADPNDVQYTMPAYSVSTIRFSSGQ